MLEGTCDMIRTPSCKSMQKRSEFNISKNHVVGRINRDIAGWKILKGGKMDYEILDENNGEENIRFYEQIESIFEFINILYEIRIKI